MEKIISASYMNKRALSKKKNKSQLINLLLKLNMETQKLSHKNMNPQPKNDDTIPPPPDYKPVPLPRKNAKKMVQDYEENIIIPPPEFSDDYKPVPLPRKNVKKMVQDYEENIIIPPPEFSDDYEPVPLPRKNVKKMVQDYEENIIIPPPEFTDDYKPIPKPRTKKPVPLPRTKIEQTNKALKGYTKSYDISIKNNKNPLAQLQNTRKAIEWHIIRILKSMKGLKFVETLRVTFKKPTNDAKDVIVYKTAYFNSKPQTIINNVRIPEALQLSKDQILNIIAQWIY